MIKKLVLGFVCLFLAGCSIFDDIYRSTAYSHEYLDFGVEAYYYTSADGRDYVGFVNSGYDTCNVEIDWNDGGVIRFTLKPSEEVEYYSPPAGNGYTYSLECW